MTALEYTQYSEQDHQEQLHRIRKANRCQGELLEEFFKKQVAQLHEDSVEKATTFHDNKRGRGEYPCIFLSNLAFMDLLEQTIPFLPKKYLQDISFLDAGCGAGHKLLLAHEFGFGKVWGAEIEEDYIKLAKKLIPLFTNFNPLTDHHRYVKFLHKDIREIDYSKFDIVYFYVPMFNQEKQIELEKRIAETMSPGSLILAAGEKHLHENKLVKRITDSTIYQKI